MSMETLAAVIAIGFTTVGLTVLGYIGFFIPVPEKKKKKWKQCPTCKRWQEAK